MVDNSGARLAQIIGSYGQAGQYGYIGDVVKVAIKEAKGDKVRGLIVVCFVQTSLLGMDKSLSFNYLNTLQPSKPRHVC